MKRLNPVYLELENESHRHSVPEGSESHFRILVVSREFENMSRVDRQRFVYSLLQEEMRSGVHALSQRTYSPDEWDLALSKEGIVKMESPLCPSKAHSTQ